MPVSRHHRGILTGGAPAISVTGDTDFGSTPVGTPVSEVFTIENTGSADLIISAIDVPDGFTLTDPVGFPITIGAGNSDTFTVEADADSVDVFSGNVSISNNSSINPYEFAITVEVANIDYSNDSPTVITPTENNLVVNGTFAAWTGDNPNSWSLSATEDASNYVTQNPAGQAQIVAATLQGIVQNVLSPAQGRWVRWSLDVKAIASGNFTYGEPITGPRTQTSTGIKTWTERIASGGQNVRILRNSLPSDFTIDDAAAYLLSNILVAEKASVPFTSQGYNHWHIAAGLQAGGYLEFDSDDYIYWYANRDTNKLNAVKVVGGTLTVLGDVAITYSDTKATFFYRTGNNLYVGYDTPANIEAYNDADYISNALISSSAVADANLNQSGLVYSFGAFSTSASNTPQKHVYRSRL